MKILILGAEGMLGQSLRNVLKAEELICWDKNDLDITQDDQVREKIIKLCPDTIINAAAYTEVDGAEKARELAFEINEAGVRNVARAASDVDCVLVHYSTDYVFPGTKQEGYQENDPPGPAVNVYGESKLAGERAIIEEVKKFYLIRTAWLYGPGGKNFVDTMLRLGHERDKVEVVDDQHGSPTYTEDLAEATAQIINGGFDYGIYHLVNAGITTWYDFAKEIYAATDISVGVEPISSEKFIRPAKRPAWSVLVNNKGPKMRAWQSALRDYIKLKS